MAIKLHEYQASGLFRAYGIPVPRSIPVDSAEAAQAAALELGGPVVVKALVLAGGRGKAGGVKVAASPAAARTAAAAILGMRIGGQAVRQVLVAEGLSIREEYYLGFAVDRLAKTVQCILSAAGGIAIEDVASARPGRIVKIPVPPCGCLPREELRSTAAQLFPSLPLMDQALDIAARLHRLFCEKDASLAEINPLVETDEHRLVAADAKIVLDDNGLYKHPELAALQNPEEYSAEEIEARALGLSYTGLDGNIGCMVNGAGLAMATMDMIQLCGGRPANFLDVGGSSAPEKVLSALRILLRHPTLHVILVSIFGGITRCDDIARGLLLARDTLRIPVPLVVRLSGTNADEGRGLLENAGIATSPDMMTAVERAVSIAARAGT